MKQLFVIIALLSSIQSFGQCFILKTDLRDCISCREGMEKLTTKFTNLPVYAVFPEYMHEDSADVDFAGRFSVSNIGLLFNDEWYHKIDCNGANSCVVGLNSNGDITFHSDLKNMNESDLKFFLEKNKPNNRPAGEIVNYRDSLRFEFDMTLARLTVTNRYTNKVMARIRSAEVDLEWIERLLSGKAKTQFTKYGKLLNKDINGYVGYFESFALTSDNTIMLKYLYHNAPDTIKLIKDFHVFIEYDFDGNYLNSYHINPPPHIRLYDPGFLLDSNDNAIFCFWYRGISIEQENLMLDTLHYIARFNRQLQEYQFVRIDSFLLPSFNVINKTYNDLSFIHSSYPFALNTYDNDIVNIKNGKSAPIIPAQNYKNEIEHAVKSNSPYNFCFFNIAKDHKGENAYYVFRLFDTIFIRKVSNDLTTLKEAAPRFHFLKSDEIIWVTVHPSVNMLTVYVNNPSKGERRYYLPLDLFL